MKFALFGPEVSEHSISVKFGKWGERWFEYMVDITPGFSMLPHGVLVGIGEGGRNKDIDFWRKTVERLKKEEIKKNHLSPNQAKQN